MPKFMGLAIAVSGRLTTMPVGELATRVNDAEMGKEMRREMGPRWPLVSVVLFAILLPTVARSAEAEGGPRIEEGYVVTPDGVRLYYQKAGSAPQVVIQPGQLFAFAEFEWLGEHVTLISYDMRNRGRSDLVQDDKAITFEQDVADLETVRRHFGAGRVALMGYSYLGKIAVLYALEHPQRVERIVQFGPVPPNFATEYEPAYVANDDPIDPEALARLRALRSERSYNLTHPREYCEEEWKVVYRPLLIGDPAKIDRMRFTGHERDHNNRGGTDDDLDYMHAPRSASPLPTWRRRTSRLWARCRTKGGLEERNPSPCKVPIPLAPRPSASTRTRDDSTSP